MMVSQLDLTGKPAAVWRYWTNAPMLGSPWRLRAIRGGKSEASWTLDTGAAEWTLETVVALVIK